jgi:hypothetical protein
MISPLEFFGFDEESINKYRSWNIRLEELKDNGSITIIGSFIRIIQKKCFTPHLTRAWI